MTDIVKTCAMCKGDGLMDINPVGGGGTRPCPHCGETGVIIDATIDLSPLRTILRRIERKIDTILGD